MNIETSIGLIAAKSYDDGMGKGIELTLNGDIICMLDVMEHLTEGGTRLIVYADYYEDEPTHIIEINKEKRFKYLSRSKDYVIIRKHFDKSILEQMEREIAVYEKHTSDDESRSSVISWWEGNITTEDLIDFYKNL